MDIKKTSKDGTVTITLTGRLDTITQEVLARELETVFASEKVNLVFDITSLYYISSAGLRVLLTAQKKINAMGTAMKIVGAKPEIKEIFDMTGFSEIMTME
jgi:anti-anti-sigma factor